MQMSFLVPRIIAVYKYVNQVLRNLGSVELSKTSKVGKFLKGLKEVTLIK